MEDGERFVGNDGLTYKATTILRKRKVTDDQLNKRAKMRREGIEKRREALRNPDFKDKVKRAEKFVLEYRETQRNFAHGKRRAKKDANVKECGPVIVALRIKGDKNLTNRQKIILKTLKLKKMHELAFIKLNEKTEGYLKVIEPLITYGIPSRKVISEVIRKRAFCKIANEYKPLKSNALVEEHLGHLGLICIDDIITVLLKGSAHFDDVLSFLGAFKLNKPTNGYGDKTKPFSTSGAWGNRQEKISELVENMI